MERERLKELLNYNPATGVFTWRVRRPRGVKVGDVAGCVTKRGYVTIGIDGKIYWAHRLAWLYVHGEMPKVFIDHRNGMKSDNRLRNLREAGHTSNQWNRVRRGSPSFDPGRRKPWRIRLTAKNKVVWWGRFETKEEACVAYAAAARAHYGEFAR